MVNPSTMLGLEGEAKMILAKGFAYGALAWAVYNLAAQLYFQYLTEWSSKVWMGY